MTVPQYYWDTCVFIAYLNDERSSYGSTIDDIRQFLEEAKEGKCQIHCSTLVIAEITKDKVKSNKWRFIDFLRDYQDAVVPLPADPNVMVVAAELRSLTYKKNGGTRKLGTADAIHLASAICLTRDYGVSLEAFHTFDDGNRRGPEGREVPLLSYEAWCEQCKDHTLAEKVIAMKREKPSHSTRRLILG